MTEETTSKQLVSLLDNDVELVSVLSSHSMMDLFKNMLKKSIVCASKKTLFYSLDHERLEPEPLARYLLKLVSEGIRENKLVWKKFMLFLNQIGEKEISEKLNKMSKSAENLLACHAFDEDNIILSLDDVSLLVNLMATITHKYDQLALALKLPVYKIEQCRENSLPMKLAHILTCWISEDTHTPPSTTLSKLKEALSGDLVAEYQLAINVEKQFVKAKKSVQHALTNENNDSDLLFDISELSIDTEVEDGKSALLYVLASPRESLCYQWQKDGQPLANNSIYSGVNEDILVINLARQGTEGEYTCCVSLQDEQTISNEISLKLIYTQKKKQLLDLYCVQGEVPKDSWPPVGTETYIQLVLLQQQHAASGILVHDKELSRDKRSEQVGKQKYSGGTATDVRYEDIFGEYKSGSLITIEGRPGSGKTTLVHKLVKDWSDGTILNNARLVFLITLRSLNETNNGSQPIFEYLENFIKESKDKRESGDGACVVLDGLDEYKSKNKTSIIYHLLNKECLPKAMIIVSSRPNVINTAIKKNLKSVTRVQTFGFNKEQIIKYVQHFPFTAGTSDSNSCGNYPVKLEKYLKNHPNVFDMCCLPVHAAMICYLYEVKNGDIPKTQTKIYEEFTLSIILRHLKRQSNEAEISSLKELSGDYKKNFDTLCKLAFIMSEKNVQVANKNELEVVSQAIDSGDSWCFGLLTVHCTFNSRRDNEYTFLHLTFQEFLTSYYIASLTKEDQLTVIKYRYAFSSAVWIFLCGLIDLKANEDLFCEINKHLHQDLLVCLSCAFESQQKIICDNTIRYLENELIFPSKISSLDISCVKYMTSNTSEVVKSLDLPTTDTITLLLNIHEKHFDHLLKLKLYEDLGANKDMMTLGRILELCTRLEEVDLTLKSISNTGARCISESFGDKLIHLKLTCISCSEGIQILLSGLKCHAELQLSLTFKNLCQQGISEMVAVLKSSLLSKIYLGNLDISECEVGLTNAADVRDAIQNCLTLGTLTISYSSLDSCSTEILISSLFCLAFLVDLDLSNQQMNDEGAICLAAILNNLALLESLDLCHNNIGTEGATATIEVLPMLKNLKDFDLSHNHIGPIGAVNITIDEVPLSVNELQDMELSHDIGPPHTAKLLTDFRGTKLEVIDLSYNNIDYTGAATLAVGLNLFTNLETIDLRNNNIGDDGAASIGTKLHSLLKLESLHLDHNNIGPTGARTFARGLKHFPRLTKLNLSNNHIGSDGANAIGIELHYLTELWSLDLSFNKIEHLSVNMKKGLSQIATLRYLELSGNCIDVNSAIRILQALKCCDIRWIDFSRDEHGDHLDCPWISVQGIVSEEDESDITALEAAAKHISSSRTLDLGFQSTPLKAAQD